jgi:hypothetical protein
VSLFSSPSIPDPSQGIALGSQVAQQQQGYNTQAGVQSQAGSMVNQVNPYGSLNYQQTGTGPNGTPLYTATEQLSPQQQNLFNLLQGTQATAGSGASNLLSGANYGSTSPTQAIGDMTSGLTGQILGQETNYLNPFFKTSRDQLDTQLRNQGLQPGEPGYDNAMRGLDTSQGLTVSNFLASAEPQAFSQASNLYQMPATMAESLANFGAPGSVNSNLTQTPGLNVQPANLTGATANETQALNSQYQSQLAQYGNMMSGLFGIPTAVLGGWAQSPSGGSAITSGLNSLFSDRRLKTDIEKVGMLDTGLPIYLYRYKAGGPKQLGLMADEVEQVHPEAVGNVGGFKTVDYGVATQ